MRMSLVRGCGFKGGYGIHATMQRVVSNTRIFERPTDKGVRIGAQSQRSACEQLRLTR